MAPRSEDAKLIIRVINFELVQPICSRYVNVTDGQTYRQTDGRLMTAISRLALRASRSKNECGSPTGTLFPIRPVYPAEFETTGILCLQKALVTGYNA